MAASKTIAGFARLGGVGVETIRYYQRRGLLKVPRRPQNGGLGGGFRHYDDEDVRRLQFIRSAQNAGFTLKEIAELLKLHATDDRARARELANKRIAALGVQIAELEAARESLRKLARACGAGSAGPCPILTAFESHRSASLEVKN
jgi:MerR family mercuric resistance operon transcriptional regulator